LSWPTRFSGRPGSRRYSALKFNRRRDISLLGGSIEREFGEIPLEGGALHSQKLKVYAMKSPSGERFVGVSIVAKAPLAASMTPFKLTSTQARELAGLLTRAAEPHVAA
jgi:hypothetical protein